MSQKQHLIFAGTTSNAGKTFITGFAGKILKEKFNIKTCPFKAQNMSNYATVCEFNKEISIAQSSQAQLIGVEPKADMNPVLLKPLGEGRSQMVIRGIPNKIISAKTYYEEIDKLKPEVDIALSNLEKDSDMIVIEGAGSAFELNLKNRDLANEYMLEKENVSSVLITNIENGGVFPAILGSYNLMNDKIKKRFKGVIINNFRGDISLFDEGIEIIEKWGIPVLGVIPHIDYNLDCEDSMAQMSSFENKNKTTISIGVIKYPRASNINDIEPLMHDPNASLSFITQRTNLDIFDKIILPGSRAVLDDLEWLNKTGILENLKKTTSEIYGICGGYQMLHNSLIDNLGTENAHGEKISKNGIGLIPANITFSEEKILKRQQYKLFNNIEVEGFEMHTGISDNYPIYFNSEKVKGSMVHEVFHNDNFRKWWLNSNNKNDIELWDFKNWKKSIQKRTSLMLENTVNWEKLLN